jgi:anti-sigma factor RsiW
MTLLHNIGRPSDADLVAFLDSELPSSVHRRVSHWIATDHKVQQRLILLAGGSRPFKDAYDSLLAQAPKERLETWLTGLPAAKANGPSTPHWWKSAGAIAAGILLFFVGIAADRLLPTSNGPPPPPTHIENQSHNADDWRQAVAEYLTLYTTETLAGIPDDANLRDKELTLVGGKMRLALSARLIALQNLSLKRAQIFEYDGKPLGHIAYLDPNDGPIALCIVGNGPDSGPQVEQREGFNVVHWSRGGHGFMLIGKTPVSRLQEFAADLSGRLAG